MDKKELRKRIRAAIRGLDAAERERSDEAVFQTVSALPEFQAARTVFAYFSVNGEVDTHRLIRAAAESGKRIALPVVLGDGEMYFAAADSELITGAFYGIPEPGPDAGRVEPESGDMILVPALCFDRQGYRLGQGGGYYDRWLELHPELFSVGLCRERFLQERVPREAHDMRVRCVATEKEAARP